MATLTSLPAELLLHPTQFLDTTSLLHYSLTCRRIYSVVEPELFERDPRQRRRELRLDRADGDAFHPATLIELMATRPRLASRIEFLSYDHSEDQMLGPGFESEVPDKLGVAGARELLERSGWLEEELGRFVRAGVIGVEEKERWQEDLKVGHRYPAWWVLCGMLPKLERAEIRGLGATIQPMFKRWVQYQHMQHVGGGWPAGLRFGQIEGVPRAIGASKLQFPNLVELCLKTNEHTGMHTELHGLHNILLLPSLRKVEVVGFGLSVGDRHQNHFAWPRWTKLYKPDERACFLKPMQNYIDTEPLTLGEDQVDIHSNVVCFTANFCTIPPDRLVELIRGMPRLVELRLSDFHAFWYQDHWSDDGEGHGSREGMLDYCHAVVEEGGEMLKKMDLQIVEAKHLDRAEWYMIICKASHNKTLPVLWPVEAHDPL